MRKCCKCKKQKPLTAFAADKSKPQGRSYYCRDCKQCKDKLRSKTRWQCNSPISKDEYDRLAKLQDYACAICKKPADREKLRKTLLADHCHIHNKARGLLCYSCNSGLGLLQDSPKLLKAALEYLMAHAVGADSPTADHLT